MSWVQFYSEFHLCWKIALNHAPCVWIQYDFWILQVGVEISKVKSYLKPNPVALTLSKHFINMSQTYHCPDEASSTVLRWNQRNEVACPEQVPQTFLELVYAILCQEQQSSPPAHILTFIPLSPWVSMCICTNTKRVLGAKISIKSMKRWDCFFQQQCRHENKAWKISNRQE